MARLLEKRLILGALLASTALSAPAHAQYVAPTDIPPVHSRVDEFSVDLVTHKIAGWLYGSVTIGPGGPGTLTWIWSDSNRLASDLKTGLVFTSEASGSQFVVYIGGVTKTFTLNGSFGTGTFSNDLGTGETLTYNSSTDQFTYTLRNGAVLLFGYTTSPFGPQYGWSGYPISLTYPGGEQIIWNRDASNVVRSITSNLGYQLRPTYDSTNQAWTKVVLFNMADVACDPLAVSCSIAGTWPTIDFTAKTVNGQAVMSNVWVSDPSTGGWTITQTIPTSAATSRTIVLKQASDQTITSVADGNGTWNYSFPQPGIAPVAIRSNSDRPGYSDQTQWDSKGNFTQIITTTKDGFKQFNYTYDANQRVNTTAVDGIVTTYTYDDRGNITQASTAPKSGGADLPIVTAAVYPATCTNSKTCNQPTSTTDANNNTTEYTYDASSGGIASVTQPAQPNGIRPTRVYTYATQNAQWLNGAGATVTGGNVYKVTTVSRCMTQASCSGTSDEVRTSFAYSASDGLEPSSITVQSGNGSLAAPTSYTYSGLGDIATVDGPLSGSADTTYFYADGFHRPTGMVGPDPDGGGSLPRRAVTIGYNYEGQIVSKNVGTTTSTGVAGMSVLQSEVTAYNAQGLKSQESLYDKNNALAGVTQYSYTPSRFSQCVARRVSTLNIPASACSQSSGNPDHIVKYAYTGASSPAEVRNGFVSDTQAADLTNGWTSSGLASQTDGKGNLTSFTYDDFDRLSSICFPNPNRSTDCELRTYDPVGNLKSRRLRDASTLQSYTYDALNRPQTKVVPEGTVTFGYDNLGEIKSIAQGTKTLSLTYDQLGRTLTQVGPQGTVTSSWDLAGRRTGLSYPGGFAISYDYLVTDELSHIYDAAGTVATYAYDTLGNRASVSYANGTSQSYAYDPLYRLNQLTNTLGTSTYSLCSTFAYNAASELTSRTQQTPNCTGTANAYGWNGATGYSRTYTTNTLNQYTNDTSTNFTYDLLGNLSQSGSTFYCYDSENHLVSVAASASCSSPTTSLAYDPLGRLSSLTKSGTTTNFAYDGTDMIGEYSGSTLIKRYVFGPRQDEPIVSYDSAGNRTFMMSDERGSITAFSNDAGAVTTATNGYDEYGIPNTDSNGVDQNNGRFGYTGQMWLGEISLAHYKARLYSPTLGRFLQTDPIGYGDGPNWYAYAHNDPVNGSDPLGLNCYATYNVVFSGGQATATLAGYTCDPLGGGGFGDLGGGGGGAGGGQQTEFTPGTPRSLTGEESYQTPWYKNSCVTDALKTGAKNLAIDAIGFIPEAGGIARTLGHQSGYRGIVADRYGSKTIRAIRKTADFENSAIGFSTDDWTSWVSAGITALDYVPVVNEFATTAAVAWDAGVTAYKVYQCPK